MRRITDEVDEELAFHLAMREEQLVRSGMSVEDARREARRQFGDVDTVRSGIVTLDQQRERAMNRIRVVSDLSQDFAYALRTLRHNPAFTFIAVATLALGIGANTAVFALIDAVLFRRLNVASPQELVVVGDPSRVGGVSLGDPRFDLLPYAVYTSARQRVKSFSGLMASGRAPRLFMTVGTQREPENPRGRLVSGNYFSVLGVPAFLGRTFGTEEDGAAGASPVAVISHQYWARRFQGDRAVVGTMVSINGAPITIIGVTPPGFDGEVLGGIYDIWLPITMQPVIMKNQSQLSDPQVSWLVWMGRLNTGVTLEQARAEIATVLPAVFKEQTAPPYWAKLAGQIKGSSFLVSDGSKGLSRTRVVYFTPLMTLMAGVGLLMLIVCANVANLLLARATTRGREMSLRAALGAGRWRVVRQLLTESTVLSVTGAAAGVVLGYWGSRLLLAIASDGGAPIPIAVGLQGRVTLFAVGVAMVAVVIFGLAPALIATRVNLADTMRAASRSLAGGSTVRGISPARLIIAAQVALSLVLLVGSGLFVRNVLALQGVETGMDRDHLLIVDIDSRSAGFVGARFAPFTDELMSRIGRLPEVAAVSYSENGVFSGTESVNSVLVEGYTPATSQDSVANSDLVGPGYAAAIGARVVEGRDLNDRDRGKNATVVLLNQTAARAYFKGGSAIGKWLRLDSLQQFHVVGVIADAQDHDLKAKPVRRVYFPYLSEMEYGPMRLIVRTRGDPAAAAGAVRRAIGAQSATMAILSLDPLPRLLRASIRAERLVAQLATGFGVLALVLAAVGLYGVMSYAISRRTNEIGVRVALGAQRHEVITMLLSDGLRTVGIGIVVGLGLSLYLTRFLEKQLTGVEPADLVSISVAVFVLVATGALATLVPALRGSRVAPVEALREG